MIGDSIKMANSKPDTVKLQLDLRQKTEELAKKEEEFAAEKINLIKEITDARKGKFVIQEKQLPEDSIKTNQKRKELENQKQQTLTLIEEEKLEKGNLESQILIKSKDFDSIKIQIQPEPINLPSEAEFNNLQQEIQKKKTEIENRKDHVEKLEKKVESLKEQFKQINFRKFLQKQLLSGNYANSVPSDIMEYCKSNFKEARELWLDAKNAYPSKISPFLLSGINSFLKITDVYFALISLTIPEPVKDLDEFSERLPTLAKAYIKIRTSVVGSLIGINIKMERGVDVAPQASFIKEIKAFLDEMASIFELES